MEYKVDHSTINRWVIKYAPQLEEVFRKKHKSQVGSSWRMDETYIKIKGKWTYLYRAVDKEGKTIDFWARSDPRPLDQIEHKKKSRFRFGCCLYLNLCCVKNKQNKNIKIKRLGRFLP